MPSTYDAALFFFTTITFLFSKLTLNFALSVTVQTLLLKVASASSFHQPLSELQFLPNKFYSCKPKTFELFNISTAPRIKMKKYSHFGINLLTLTFYASVASQLL